MAAFSVINFSDSSVNILNSDKEGIYYCKNQKIAPAMSNYANNMLLANEAKRKGRVKDVIKVQNPAPPIAVARRNARERNRVKQVNNGFAVLRQHIPTSIAPTPTEAENARNKKLSKVETLRMAVEYIRQLEDLLSLSSSSSPEVNDLENDNSMSSFGSYPMMSTPNHDLGGNYQIKTEMDVKMGRVPRTNTYQLIHGYEDEENIHPNDLDDDMLSDSHLMNSGLELSGARDMTFLHSMHSAGSLSPEMNSEHSLSPRTIEGDSKPFILNDMDSDRYARLKFSHGARDGIGNLLTPVSVDDNNQHGHSMMSVTSWWEHEQLKS